LNPPASRAVFRDCYCSGASKGSIYIHPLDLQIQSGFFDDEDFKLEFIDAVFERLRPAEALKRIEAFLPDSILSLVGHACFDSDAAFLHRVKTALPATRLYLSGDIARFSPAEVFERLPYIDGILTDFGTPDLVNHIRGVASPRVLTRTGTKLPAGSVLKAFNYPHPQGRVINRYAYRLPFFKSPRYYSIATGFGCPFSCLYCNTHLLGYRTRAVEQVVEELHFASGHGFRSLYVRDATFLYDKERTMRLFREWERTGLQFQWICFTRPDLIDEELAEFAARLGCCLMMVGVESYDEDCLNAVSRSIKTGDIVNAFRTLRKFGIRSAAQIIVGLHDFNHDPGQDSRDYQKRIKNFLKILDPDFVSLNSFLPRPGIPDSRPILAQLQSIAGQYREVAKSINKSFYFRPRSIYRQLTAVRSLRQFLLQANIAAGLLRHRRN
jgi:radical SAM superfamily enzyme YgiQ (UPF0313 family)